MRKINFPFHEGGVSPRHGINFMNNLAGGTTGAIKVAIGTKAQGGVCHIDTRHHFTSFSLEDDGVGKVVGRSVVPDIVTAHGCLKSGVTKWPTNAKW